MLNRKLEMMFEVKDFVNNELKAWKEEKENLLQGNIWTKRNGKQKLNGKGSN